MKRIGLLTAGGDCPGLNAVIRAVVKSAAHAAVPIHMIGILDGYAGLLQGRIQSLHDADVSGLLPRGGTILGTSNRDNPFNYLSTPNGKPEDRSRDVLGTMHRERLDGLIAIGGDGTLRCALELSKLGIPIIGVPKTIDNDLGGTDITFGFDTALFVATEAIDRLHTTAESHHRVLICEVMGRHAGWIGLRSGIAGGGDIILIPEIPYDMNHIAHALETRVKMGKTFSIIVVSEGALSVNGHVTTQGITRSADRRARLGGVSHVLAKTIEEQTHLETREVILGHLQRGGTPTPFDRWLATRFGTGAIDLVCKGRWNHMVSLRGNEITSLAIEEAVQQNHRVDPMGQEVQTARLVGTTFGDGKVL